MSHVDTDEMKEKQTEEKTVVSILDEVSGKICSDICKWPDKCLDEADGDAFKADGILEEYCDKCPLQRLC